MTGDQIVFDEDVRWFGESFSFWAELGKKRIRCIVTHKAINELPGFRIARSDEIGLRKTEIRDALKAVAESKIRRGMFSNPDLSEIEIDVTECVNDFETAGIGI